MFISCFELFHRTPLRKLWMTFLRKMNPLVLIFVKCGPNSPTCKSHPSDRKYLRTREPCWRRNELWLVWQCIFSLLVSLCLNGVTLTSGLFLKLFFFHVAETGAGSGMASALGISSFSQLSPTSPVHLGRVTEEEHRGTSGKRWIFQLLKVNVKSSRFTMDVLAGMKWVSVWRLLDLLWFGSQKLHYLIACGRHLDSCPKWGELTHGLLSSNGLDLIRGATRIMKYSQQ